MGSHAENGNGVKVVVNASETQEEVFEPTDLTEIENGKPGYDNRTLPPDWKFGVKLQNVMEESIYKYMLETFTRHREHEASKELWERTWKLTQRGEMMTLPDQVQFLRLMVKMSGAKKALEIGVFTGYSLLNIALALPSDGKVVAVDPGEDPKFGWPCFVKAGVADKVEIKQTTGLEYLDSLKGKKDCFDFAFVDADKVNYVNYHPRLMELVRVGGVIIYDDTLWFGLVGGKDPHNLLKNDYMRTSLEGIKAINAMVANDPNLEVATIFMGYGVTVCYRTA